MATKAAPRALGASGRALWASIAPKYRLRPDELARLESACKVADVLGRLEQAWAEAGHPMVSKGSMGQEVIHPLIGEIRTQRGALDRMLAGLKLPDEAAGESVNQQREAGQARQRSPWAIPG